MKQLGTGFLAGQAKRLKLPRGGQPSGKETRTTAANPAEESANEDRVLIERARFGDQLAFEQLIAKYQDRTRYIARNFVLDDEAARDVAQEAFLRVYRCLDRYDPKYRFYTWFYRLVVHLAIDHVRRNKKPMQRLSDHAAETLGRWEATGRGMEQGETKARVMQVLQEVPSKYRRLLVLRDIEGFTSKEIAEVAGWNHATVRWRLHRARKLFRAAWETRGYPEEL